MNMTKSQVLKPGNSVRIGGKKVIQQWLIIVPIWVLANTTELVVLKDIMP